MAFMRGILRLGWHSVCSLYVLNAETSGCRKSGCASSTGICSETGDPLRLADRIARESGANARVWGCNAHILRIRARITRSGALVGVCVPLWNSYKFLVCSFYFPTDVP